MAKKKIFLLSYLSTISDIIAGNIDEMKTHKDPLVRLLVLIESIKFTSYNQLAIFDEATVNINKMKAEIKKLEKELERAKYRVKLDITKYNTSNKKKPPPTFKIN